MSEESLNKLIAIFGAGLGLLLASGVSMLRCNRIANLRFGLGAVVSAGGGLMMAVYVPWTYALVSASFALTAFVAVVLLKSSLLAKTLSAGQSIIRRPFSQALLLAAAGIVAMGGSIYDLTVQDEAAIESDMARMTESTWRPETQLAADATATTDQGHPISLREPITLREQAEMSVIEKRIMNDLRYEGAVIRLAPPNDTHNCHGWVFTGGRYWLSPEDVEQILKYNRYERISEPRPGDVVIYRNGPAISHTAIVRSPAANGRPVLVEGKWGWMGVYLHGVNDSSYGTTYEFYRSARQGHLLVGLGGHATDVARETDRKPDETQATD